MGGAGDGGQQECSVEGRLGRCGFRSSGVETDDCVNMDRASSLVLDDLGEAETNVVSQLAAGNADEGGQSTLYGDGGAAPEFTSVRVPQDGRLVVEAVGAQRLAYERVVSAVDDRTGPGAAVNAEACARMAGRRSVGRPGGVHGPEARRG